MQSRMKQVTQSLEQISQRSPSSFEFDKSKRRRIRVRHFRVLREPRFECGSGMVLKGRTCVKCPVGTFMNTTSGVCESCGFGRYQSLEGQLSCIPCPEGTSTRKQHSKSVRDCKRLCPSGTYGRKRRAWAVIPGLRPCTTCEVGTYQNDQGQTECIKCPGNTTTNRRGSKTLQDCKEPCLPGTISHTGLAPCVPCPDGYAQPLPGQTSCVGPEMEKIHNYECFSSPCLNGGSCEPVATRHYTCKCAVGFIGSACEVIIRGCDSSPCLNGGSCSDTGLNYTCSCTAGYYGQNCEINIDECVSNPCFNGGTCVDNIASFICLCEYGFKGDRCEENLNECDASPCVNGGLCVDGIANYTCDCLEGYTGRHCENELSDPCDADPCLNGGTCNGNKYNYSCDCAPGYEGVSCEVDIDDCTSNPCHNGGTCKDLLSGFICHCKPTYIGNHCETEVTGDFFLKFPSSSMTDYVILDGPRVTLEEVTVCLWLKSDDKFNYGTVFSYAAGQQDNSFTLTDYNGFVLYVNGQRVITDITANDGAWHFICASWASSTGNWGIYIDGKLGDEGVGLANGTRIPANGTLVLGQEQDRLGGGFSEAEAFTGHMANVAMWNQMLGVTQVLELATSCPVMNVGNVFTWSQFLSGIRGNLMVESSYFCSACGTLTNPAHGTVRLLKESGNVSQDIATYSCDDGYMVYWKSKTWKTVNRKCLKQGEWEDVEPVCKRISCGFPGYFPRGRIFGHSYLYSDIIKYVCHPGYKLIGSWKRACLATGEWSDSPPRCQGRPCRRLSAVENSHIHLLADDKENDRSSSSDIEPEYGHQVEVECDAGHKLVGHNVLTCLVNGKWDYELPHCERTACFTPPVISHGYVVLERKSNMIDSGQETPDTNTAAVSGDLSNNLQRDMGQTQESMYSVGDIVAYRCDSGYTATGEGNTTTLSCKEGGVWQGDVPNCLPITCPKVTPLENGFFYLNLSNGTDLETSENSTKIFDYDKMYEYLTQIHVECNKGFQLVGPRFRICLEKGVWSSAEPQCLPVECDKSQFEPIFKIYNVTSEVTALDGTLKMEGNKFGDSAEFKCHSGFKLSSQLSIPSYFQDSIRWTCSADGNWDIANISDYAIITNYTGPLCEKTVTGCYAPKVPENAYFSEDFPDLDGPFPFGTIKKLKCQAGFKLNGNSEWICMDNGRWNGENVTCDPVRCRPPPIPLNTEKVLLTRWYFYGTVVAHKCKVGYRSYGDLSTRCQASGRWSRIRGKCSPVSCGKPALSNGATILGQSYLYQDQVIYNCPQGTRLVGDAVLTCQSNGIWSDTPQCYLN